MARSRHSGSSSVRPASSVELWEKFIQECSLARPSTCEPCPLPNLSPLALLGQPSLDPEVMLARAQTLARTGFVKLTDRRSEPIPLGGGSDSGLNEYHLLPIHERGFAVGVQMSPRRSKILFEHGMEPHDVLIAVNGRPTLGKADLSAWTEKLLVLEILRGDAFVVLVLEQEAPTP